jgi:molecular chaperone IbpA
MGHTLVSMLLKEDMAMRMIDVSPLTRFAVGFDRLFDMIESAVQADPASNYPPYNIEKTGEDSYRVTLAIAGFKPEELSITSQQNQLIVAGNKAKEDGVEYIYRGIAGRAFQRQFSLADYVKVVGASLNDGLLTIDLVREVPEAMKPRRIEIANNNQPQIESKVAA